MFVVMYEYIHDIFKICLLNMYYHKILYLVGHTADRQVYCVWWARQTKISSPEICSYCVAPGSEYGTPMTQRRR
jgi:hypothetical protein